MWRFADRLIDGFLDDGSCEFVSEYAEPFTLTVIADLEGVPEADHSLFRDQLATVHQEWATSRWSSSTSDSARTSRIAAGSRATTS